VKTLHLKYKLKLLILVPHLLIAAHLFFADFRFDFFFFSLLVYFALMAIQFIGLHRLFSHRSYVTYRFVEVFFIYACVMLGQGSCLNWVANHRTHHKHADLEGDPHSPQQKPWWKVWLGTGEPVPVSSFIVRDLLTDSVQLFVHKNYFKIVISFGLAFFLVGGFDLLIFGFCWPMILSYHATGAINVICHTWGRRYFDTPDFSYNNWMVFIFTLGGEGWHNYHHAYPNDHRHGHGKYEIDLYAFFIERVLSKSR
jgi:fatty-acid desaturase